MSSLGWQKGPGVQRVEKGGHFSTLGEGKARSPAKRETPRHSVLLRVLVFLGLLRILGRSRGFRRFLGLRRRGLARLLRLRRRLLSVCLRRAEPHPQDCAYEPQGNVPKLFRFLQ